MKDIAQAQDGSLRACGGPRSGSRGGSLPGPCCMTPGSNDDPTGRRAAGVDGEPEPRPEVPGPVAEPLSQRRSGCPSPCDLGSVEAAPRDRTRRRPTSNARWSGSALDRGRMGARRFLRARRVLEFERVGFRLRWDALAGNDG
jgi:hypothetical protein